MPIAPTPTRFRLIAWRDSVIEDTPGATPTDSDDTARWWLPILGPTATLLARRLAASVTDPAAADWEIARLAASFGVQPAVMTRALGRLVWFGVAWPNGNGAIAVRTVLPPLSNAQRERLPAHVGDEYLAWLARTTPSPR